MVLYLKKIESESFSVLKILIVSVLLANPQTLGEIDAYIRYSNQAVYVDRTYNAGHYLQSLDRITGWVFLNKLQQKFVF